MSRIPDVKELLELSPGRLGLILLAVSIGAVLGLPTAGPIAHRIGAVKTVRLGMALAMPGIALAGLAVQAQTSMFLVMPGLFLLGLGNGIWDVAQNLEGTVVEQVFGGRSCPGSMPHSAEAPCSPHSWVRA